MTGSLSDPKGRPRIVVTTDPELDDLNSMLRLVLYTNQIDIAGLVYSSSEFHFAGDPDRGIAPHRWPPRDATMHIDQAVDAYSQVYDNLHQHDARYPHPAALAGVIRVGNIGTRGDVGRPTPGSDLIRDVLMDDDPRPVFLQAWGGLNTIARALLSIEEEHAGSPEWPRIHARVTGKAILTSFGLQDDTFQEVIRPRWPDVQLRQVATMAWGYFAWDVTDAAGRETLTAEWMREHVTDMGPVGAAYRVWGDGLQMAAGFDDEDYFGLRDLTADELRARGYRVWSALHPAGSWISEGDSSNFALLIDNGLHRWHDPKAGGWGGRQERDPDDPHVWKSVGFSAFDPRAGISDWGEAGRWVADFQHDLAGRLHWSVTPRYKDANHHPWVRVANDDITASAGASVWVEVECGDPDGDAVTVTAYEYAEAGTLRSALGVAVGSDGRVMLTVPMDARPGDVAHIIIEVVDHARMPLKAYARVRVTVE